MTEQDKTPYQHGQEVRAFLESDKAMSADGMIMQALNGMDSGAYAQFLRGLLGHPNLDELATQPKQENED